MRRTAVVRNQRFLEHRTPAFHPESPRRLEAIYEALKTVEGLVDVPMRPATREELGLVHNPAYISRIEATAGRDHVMLDPDTHTSARSFEVARLATGSLLEALGMILRGEADNGFAFVRPPGHHAEAARAMGFCLFNNVAIAAKVALEQGLERVLIVDWDLHHGNGTQHAFYGDPRVLYFSTHQYPYYPGTGGVEEVGTGPGEGYTVNVPLPGRQGDADYLAIYRRLLEPIALQFSPQLILVSAGFDPHRRDPLGAMLVSDEGFAALAHCLLELADRCCQGRVLMSLEGGYDLEALRGSAVAVVRQLQGSDPPPPEPPGGEARLWEHALRVQRRYWRGLG